MRVEDQTFVATVGELRAMLQFVSKDITRAYLHTLCFDFEHRRIAAADGHTLAVLQVIKGKVLAGEVHLVGATNLNDLLKGSKPAAEVQLRFGSDASVGHQATFVGNCGQLAPLSLVDAKFPPIEQVIPERLPGNWSGGAICGFDSTYLARLPVLRKAMSDGGGKSCQWRMQPPPDALSPTRFDWTVDGVEALVVIMPVKI